MENYSSRKLANNNEPIVYSFDLDNECEQFSFGVSSTKTKTTIDQNLYIFKNKPYWHNSISNDISCYIDEKSKEVCLSNCGEQLLNKEIFIICNGSSNIDSMKNLNDSTTFDYDFYMESDNISDNDISIYFNNKHLKKEEIEITPICIKEDKTFTNSIEYSSEECYLIIDDETVLAIDYEYSFTSSNEKYTTSTILPMIQDKIDNYYYTDKIPNKDCRIRFVISDKGRFMTISYADESSNNYTSSDSFILSNNMVEKQDNVSVRFSIDDSEYCNNLSSNF